MTRTSIAIALAAAVSFGAAPAFAATLAGGPSTQKHGGANKSMGMMKSGRSATKASPHMGRTDQGTGTTLGGGQKDGTK